MNLNDPPALAAFRKEVQDWIANDVPASVKNIRQGIVQGPGWESDALRPLLDALGKKGWQAPAWPVECGGAGFDVSEQVVFFEECDMAGIPDFRSTGLVMLGPVLIQFGTEAQKQRFLGPIMRQEETWAQGYSEPQAGSDLASLQLKATVSSEGFVLNGQKIWTSKAHRSDWLFVLVRTNSESPRRQDGISFVLLPTKSKGITTNPIVTIDGFHHFNEVFFDNVEVPRENLVGELNQGWQIAKALLGHERFTHPTANPLVMYKAIENLKTAARNAPEGMGSVWDQPLVKQQAACLEMDADCFRYTRYRTLTKLQRGKAPGPEQMLFKLFGAELNQRIVAMQQQVEGMNGVRWDEDWQNGAMGETGRHASNIMAATLRGGSSEVQRNIIVKRILGLPE